MCAIPKPVCDGAPYRLRIGDRINYFLRFHAIQIFSSGDIPDIEFPDAAGGTTPRYVLPKEIAVDRVEHELNVLLQAMDVPACAVLVPSSYPSVNTYEVKAIA